MHRINRGVAAGLAVVFALALAGPAAAKSKPSPLLRVAVKGAAQFLGVKPVALQKQVAKGQSLAQIATAQGKTTTDLEAAMVAAVKAKLDARVSAGKLTAAKEQAVLTRIAKRIDKLVNRTGRIPGPKRAIAHLGRVLHRAAAKFLGVKPVELRADLKAGQTLAQVAAAQGKSTDDLKAAMLNAVKTRLDKRVAAGKLTADREAKILARVQTRIAKLVGA